MAMKFGHEPIAHRPPLKRIDLNPPRPPELEMTAAGWDAWMHQHEGRRAAARREAERIWDITRTVARGDG